MSEENLTNVVVCPSCQVFWSCPDSEMHEPACSYYRDWRESIKPVALGLDLRDTFAIAVTHAFLLANLRKNIPVIRADDIKPYGLVDEILEQRGKAPK